MQTAKATSPPAEATLQDVVDRLLANHGLSDGRKRDLRSAVTVFGKVVGQPLAAIPFDLAVIRNRLDAMVPAQLKVSRKRWANLRSDLSAAITASGLVEMLKTVEVELSPAWADLL
jgi:hypothetical protein